MSFTAALILIPLGCYALASVLYAIQGNIGLSVAYLGYALGNVGLLIVDRVMAK